MTAYKSLSGGWKLVLFLVAAANTSYAQDTPLYADEQLRRVIDEQVCQYLETLGHELREADQLRRPLGGSEPIKRRLRRYLVHEMMQMYGCDTPTQFQPLAVDPSTATNIRSDQATGNASPPAGPDNSMTRSPTFQPRDTTAQEDYQTFLQNHGNNVYNPPAALDSPRPASSAQGEGRSSGHLIMLDDSQAPATSVPSQGIGPNQSGHDQFRQQINQIMEQFHRADDRSSSLPSRRDQQPSAPEVPSVPQRTVGARPSTASVHIAW